MCCYWHVDPIVNMIGGQRVYSDEQSCWRPALVKPIVNTHFSWWWWLPVVVQIVAHLYNHLIHMLVGALTDSRPWMSEYRLRKLSIFCYSLPPRTLQNIAHPPLSLTEWPINWPVMRTRYYEIVKQNSIPEVLLLISQPCDTRYSSHSSVLRGLCMVYAWYTVRATIRFNWSHRWRPSSNLKCVLTRCRRRRRRRRPLPPLHFLDEQPEPFICLVIQQVWKESYSYSHTHSCMASQDNAK